MAVTTVSGQELTAEQVQRILIAPLHEQAVFLAANPRMFDSNGSQVRVPKLGGPITDPGWTGESEAIPERDADFDEIVLLPSTLKSVKVITRFSNELARQSVVSLDAALQDRLVRDVANKLDAQFLGSTGDGTTTPKGLLAYTGTQSIDLAGVAPTLDNLHDAWGLSLGANVNMNSLRWILRPEQFVQLRKVKDGQQRYQLQPDPTQDGVFRLLGAPVTVTKHLPLVDGADPAPDTSTVVLADFSQIAVARDMAPTVTILRERYADTDEMALRVVARYDAQPMNAEAVVLLKNAA